MFTFIYKKYIYFNIIFATRIFIIYNMQPKSNCILMQISLNYEFNKKAETL